jgi:uncharacterized membrane protein
MTYLGAEPRRPALTWDLGLPGAGAHRHTYANLPSADGEPPAVQTPVRWHSRVIMTLCLVTAGVATAFGLIHLWPSGHNPPEVIGQAFAARGVTFPAANVVDVAPFRCDAAGEPSSSPQGAAGPVCSHLKVRVETGVNQGDTVTVNAPPVVYQSGVSAGDDVQLVRIPPTNGAPATYTFFDFDRKLPLATLSLIFAVVVVAVARLRGAMALAGIAVAALVLVKFMLPALLQGESAFAVGLVGSSTIMFVVIYLAHGPSMRSSTALAGTLIGTLIAASVGAWAVRFTHLTGLSSDDTSLLSAVANNVSLQGLLACGVIVAGLGILNDVTITQASAVWELRATNPRLTRRELFATSMRIGRDHIASSVYTIVFAYAGAALPVLLLIEIYQRGLVDVLVNETVAEEVVRTLASGIGLVLAVPVTTAIAVLCEPQGISGRADGA